MGLIVITPNMTNITIRSKLPKIKNAKEIHQENNLPIKNLKDPAMSLETILVHCYTDTYAVLLHDDKNIGRASSRYRV